MIGRVAGVDGRRPVKQLYDALKQCAERLDRYARHDRRIGEQNTKASLIEPVIGALGWDVTTRRRRRSRPSFG